MDIRIDIQSKLTTDLIAKLATKQDNWKQELHDIGILLLRSIDKNFTYQGRPVRWKQSQSAINRHGMTLVDTGRLRRSVTVVGGSDNVFDLNPTILKMSTQVPYAKYLQEPWPFS